MGCVRGRGTYSVVFQKELSSATGDSMKSVFSIRPSSLGTPGRMVEPMCVLFLRCLPSPGNHQPAIPREESNRRPLLHTSTLQSRLEAKPALLTTRTPWDGQRQGRGWSATGLRGCHRQGKWGWSIKMLLFTNSKIVSGHFHMAP